MLGVSFFFPQSYVFWVPNSIVPVRRARDVCEVPQSAPPTGPLPTENNSTINISLAMAPFLLHKLWIFPKSIFRNAIFYAMLRFYASHLEQSRRRAALNAFKRLQNALKTPSKRIQGTFKTPSKRLQNAFETPPKSLQRAFKRLQNAFETPRKRLQNASKTPWKRM